MTSPGAEPAPFVGSKVALFVGARLLVVLRDDKPGLPWANQWDFPGGGREGDETPLDCALRETREEVGLDLTGAPLAWQGTFPSASHPGQTSWFFVIRQPARAYARARLGDEGQCLARMTPRQFLTHPQAIDFLQARLRVAMAGMRAAP